jgi:hypothetical protein
MKIQIVGAIMLAGVIGGCSTADLAKLESPTVINGIALGSHEACCQAAQREPAKSAVALRVLNGLVPQMLSCQAGLMDCMPADPNAAE